MLLENRLIRPARSPIELHDDRRRVLLTYLPDPDSRNCSGQAGCHRSASPHPHRVEDVVRGEAGKGLGVGHRKSLHGQCPVDRILREECPGRRLGCARLGRHDGRDRDIVRNETITEVIKCTCRISKTASTLSASAILAAQAGRGGDTHDSLPSGAIDARLSQLLTGEGLNCSSWSVLMMIYSDRTGTVRPSSIGQALSQSRAHMTRLADELVASGWVERLPDAADRRAVALRLSSEARQRMQLLLPRVWALYEEMLGGLEPASLDPLGNKACARC